MVSQAEIDQLRMEANTIMTRIQRVDTALEQARSEEGSHWDKRELTLTVETPQGEEIDVTLDLDEDAANNAQTRYEAAKELEAGELGDVATEALEEIDSLT